MLVRRRTVSTTLAVAITAVVTATLTGTVSAGASPGASPRDLAVPAAVPDPTTSTLRELAQHTKLRIGTAVNMDALANDATYRQMVGDEFDTVTPENVMKWEVVEPQQGKYDFTQADQLVAFAKAHGQKVRGHNLVWHNQLPKWLTSGTWTAAQLRAILKQHIFTEAGHFRGQIWAWDVLNEAVDDTGNLRNDLWLQKLGPGYIADVFRWAHQADPKAILFYNDYNIESFGAKSNTVYNLIKQLRGQGVPIQAVGFQGHLSTDYPFPNDLLQNMRRFAALGIDTAITEADVRHTLPSNPAKVNAQAQGFSLMLQSCLLVKNCISYTLWGFTDKYNWVPGTFPGQGEATPFDVNFKPKPAYDTMRRDLALAPTLRSRGVNFRR
jgi:endo-1,4-beta-xylanase